MFRLLDDDETGSRERYAEDARHWDHLARIQKPRIEGHSVAERRALARAEHRFWWVLHNCVAHPLIGVLPIGPMFDLHDWSSRRLHGAR